jgi:hypothetical protein
MFDLNELTAEPAPGEEFSPPFQMALFDRRVRMPLEWLVESIRAESGEDVSVEDLRRFAADGWFPLADAVGGNREPGVYLYTPSRVGLYLQLQRQGYAAEELRDFAEREEWLIDNCLTTEDLDLLYLDDDLDVLVMNARAEIKVLEMNVRYRHDARPESELRNEIASCERFIQRLEGLCWNELPLERRNRYARLAFTCRFRDEFIRIQMLDGDRAKVRSGFSPFVFFRRCEYSSDGAFSGQDVDWQMTLEAAGDTEPPIRLPGLRLIGGAVQTTRTFTPSEYERVWREYRLDDYSRAWATLKALRICLHCLAPLPAETDDKRRYCTEGGRNAARQRRFRQKRPERVMEIQERYWTSQPGMSAAKDSQGPDSGAAGSVNRPQKVAQKH